MTIQRLRIALCGPAVTVVLGACTPMHWVKADASAADLERDSIECRQEAFREAQFRAWAFQPIGPRWVRDPSGRLFATWPRPDPFFDPFFEEARLASFCLRAKGYALVPVAPQSPQAVPPVGPPTPAAP